MRALRRRGWRSFGLTPKSQRDHSLGVHAISQAETRRSSRYQGGHSQPSIFEWMNPHATMISRKVATAKNPQLAAVGGHRWMKFIP